MLASKVIEAEEARVHGQLASSVLFGKGNSGSEMRSASIERREHVMGREGGGGRGY